MTIRPIFIKDRVSSRLRECRECKQLTQAELADRCEFPPALISHYECGQRLPGPENLFTLCQALEVRADYILGLTNDLP